MALGMLEIREDGSLGKRNDMRIQKAMPSINTVESSLSTNEECSDSKEDRSKGTNGEDTRVDSRRVGKQTALNSSATSTGESIEERHSDVFSVLLTEATKAIVRSSRRGGRI